MVLALLIFACVKVAVSSYSVSTTDGNIEGVLFEDRDVIGYLGIPYAEPPISNLRLEEPVPVGIREETLIANKWPKKCFSFKPGEKLQQKSEDCLYLNILVPHIPTRSKPHLLVLFTNADFDDKILIRYVNGNLGLAVVHFRQGPLGFFGSTNPGISDVETAISWLNRNKNNFGIGEFTLLAENDDASMLAYALAENNEVRFARAILLNGNTAVRHFQPKHRRVKPVLRLLKNLDCKKDNSESVKACLKTVDMNKLLRAATNLKLSDELGAPFRPKNSVEDRIYPVLIGFQSSLSDDYRKEEDFDMTFSSHNFEEFLGELFPEKKFSNWKLLRRIAYHHYVDTLGNPADVYLLWKATRKMLLDRDFIVPTRNLVFSLKPEINPVYVLEYTVSNPISTCFSAYTSEMYEAFCNRLWRYFGHFAIHGEPAESKCDLEDPSWPRLKSTKRDYYMKVEKNGSVSWNFEFYQSAYAFWNNLIPELAEPSEVPKVASVCTAEASECSHS